MSFILSAEPVARRPLPKTIFGKDWTTVLYNRFHALKNKASLKNIPFEFESFDEFLEALTEKADYDYHPGTHRIKFNLDGEARYNRDTLRIIKSKTRETVPRAPTMAGSAPAVAKPSAHYLLDYPQKAPNGLSELDKLRLMGLMTSKLLGGFEGSIEELVTQTAAELGITLHFN